MTRLTQRAIAQLAKKTGATVGEITNMTIWAPLAPSTGHLPRKIDGQGAPRRWAIRMAGDDFIPTVQKRGAAIIEARGASSAASGPTRLSTVHDWVFGTPDGDWYPWRSPRMAPTVWRRA